ncbi:hypothetical protein B0H65DRAFT_209890 [Neurospora tetraspora]|uniref:Uncharacterized protein n=1 Tax=Neurospora tetraspora TaxID=94610 RepID=A0AAE0JFV3_9PEZI|nr:hypothetical protein B0H65DRAFT_209890 [Neurospora tetraspora]
MADSVTHTSPPSSSSPSFHSLFGTSPPSHHSDGDANDRDDDEPSPTQPISFPGSVLDSTGAVSPRLRGCIASPFLLVDTLKVRLVEGRGCLMGHRIVGTSQTAVSASQSGGTIITDTRSFYLSFITHPPLSPRLPSPSITSLPSPLPVTPLSTPGAVCTWAHSRRVSYWQ